MEAETRGARILRQFKELAIGLPGKRTSAILFWGFIAGMACIVAYVVRGYHG